MSESVDRHCWVIFKMKFCAKVRKVNRLVQVSKFWLKIWVFDCEIPSRNPYLVCYHNIWFAFLISSDSKVRDTVAMKVKLKSTVSIDQWHTALIKCHWDFESKKAEFLTFKRFKRIIKLFNITEKYSIWGRWFDQSEFNVFSV